MRAPSIRPTSLDELYQLFDEPAPGARLIDPGGVPQPEQRLLAHENHMTVTLENFHDTKVTLEVLDTRRADHLYARKILLRHGTTGKVVQYGIMQFNFKHCSDAVRDEILEQGTPLGRILIAHGLLRRISTHALLELQPNDEIEAALETTQPVYGRLATIFCDEEPAVALLEVVSPPPSRV
ncbi:MAG: hypothetical protein AAGA81_02835 [Acidobacteriota bacterium]